MIVVCAGAQAPRRKDMYELFIEEKKRWDAGTPTVVPAPAPALNAAWLAQHKVRPACLCARALCPP